jgi:hypothetical protein
MNNSALGVFASLRFETPKHAPIFELEEEEMNNHASRRSDDAAAPSETSELTRVLAALLQDLFHAQTGAGASLRLRF